MLLAPRVFVDGGRALSHMHQLARVPPQVAGRLSYQAAEVVAAISAMEDGVLIVAQVASRRHACFVSTGFPSAPFVPCVWNISLFLLYPNVSEHLYPNAKFEKVHDNGAQRACARGVRGGKGGAVSGIVAIPTPTRWLACPDDPCAAQEYVSRKNLIEIVCAAGAEGENSPFDLLEDDSVSVRPRDAAAGDEVNFSFDKVFDREALQEDVFKSVMEDSVDAVLRGFNATVLAYGQSGAGKTFTMFGDDVGNPGIIPRAVAEIFQRIHADSGGGIFVVKASMLEIYMEEMKDLLRPTSHKLRCEQFSVPCSLGLGHICTMLIESVLYNTGPC